MIILLFPPSLLTLSPSPPLPSLPSLLPLPSDMIDLESKFEVLEGEVKEINANKETLKKNLLDLIELQHILIKTQGFFMEVSQTMR